MSGSRQPPDELNSELDELRQEIGPEAWSSTCRVLAAVVRWLRLAGHGDVKLSAMNHVLGEKFRVDSVVTVGGKIK
jgi:hypothetical protein